MPRTRWRPRCVVVATLAGRCTAVDVLDLATLAPVRRTLSLTPADLERFGRWVDELGTSWGLDPDQRDEWLAATSPRAPGRRGSTDCCSAPRSRRAGRRPVAPSFPGEVSPFDDIAADDMRSAGRLAELVARLREARSLLAGRHRIDEWTERLTAVLSATCSVPPDEAWQLASVAGAIDGLGEQATVGGAVTDVALDAREVAAVLDQALGTRAGDCAHGRATCCSPDWSRCATCRRVWCACSAPTPTACDRPPSTATICWPGAHASASATAGPISSRPARRR